MHEIVIPLEERRAATNDGILFGAIVGAIVTGLFGTVVLGVLLGFEWVALPWSHAFAVGILGGAAAGLLIGATIAWIYERSEPRWVAASSLRVATSSTRSVARPASRAQRSTHAARG